MFDFIAGFIIGLLIGLAILKGFIDWHFLGFLHLDLVDGKVGLKMTDYPKEGMRIAIFKIESQKNSSPI